MPPHVRPLITSKSNKSLKTSTHTQRKRRISSQFYTMDNEEIPQDAGDGGGDGGDSSKPKEESKPGEWNDCNFLWIQLWYGSTTVQHIFT